LLDDVSLHRLPVDEKDVDARHVLGKRSEGEPLPQTDACAGSA
jgi:hypothetical protein